MPISESFRGPDQPTKHFEYDVRKEAVKMVERHEQRLTDLREQSVNPDAFEEAALNATETFKTTLSDFLHKHLSPEEADQMYEELAGSLSDEIANIIPPDTDDSSLSDKPAV